MLLLQWNIWYKENPDNIVAEIKRINPDLICAQEFVQRPDKTDTAKYIAEKLGYDYFYVAAETWDNRPDISSQGNAIFSRLPIIGKTSVHVKPLKNNPRDATDEGRVYVEVTVNDGNLAYTVGTVHLSYTPRFNITEEREMEVDNLVNVIKTKKENYILAGDLNASPDSYVVKGIAKYLVNGGPPFEQNTWTTKPFNYKGFVENELNWRIDHVFVTPDIKIKSTRIIETKFSDHLPILVEVGK